MTLNRSNKPAPAAEISFSLPEVEEFRLNNGLRVLFVKKDTLPMLQFNLICDAGSKFDPEGKKGLSNICSMMLDEGADEYDALELSDEFDTLGAYFNINGDQDSIYISLQTLKENYSRSLELFGKVLTSPHLDEPSLNREKSKVITRLLQIKDSTEEIADIVFEHIIFGKENPYSYPTIGYKSDVESISKNEVDNFFEKYITPANSALVVVGSIELNELKNELNKYLKNWQNGETFYVTIPPKTMPERTIFLSHKKASVQTEIRIGHLSAKRDMKTFFPKTVLNTILGGQFTSRINLNLRERKGYTYGAHSRFSYYKESAYFYVSTSVGAENSANAVSEILDELEKIKSGVTKEELEFAKSSIIRKFPSNFETYRQVAANLTGKILYKLPDDYFNNYLENIKKVNIDEVNNAAIQNIFADKAIIVLAGDKFKLVPQLNKAGYNNIIEVDENGNTI